MLLICINSRATSTSAEAQQSYSRRVSECGGVVRVRPAAALLSPAPGVWTGRYAFEHFLEGGQEPEKSPEKVENSSDQVSKRSFRNGAKCNTFLVVEINWNWIEDCITAALVSGSSR